MNNERLKKFTIFSDLTDDELNHFGDALKEVKIEKGQPFIKSTLCVDWSI